MMSNDVTRDSSQRFAHAGQLLFTGAITPRDPESGELVRSLNQVPLEPSRVSFPSLLANIQMEAAIAQAGRIYQTLSDMLGKEGASLADVLRQRIFLPDMRDLPALEKVMDVMFGAQKPPTTVIKCHRTGLDEGLVLWLDAVALIPKADGVAKTVINIPELSAASRGFPQATRAGNILFLSGIAGIPPGETAPANSIAGLGAEAEALLQPDVAGGIEEQHTAETWVIFKNIERILATQGATLSDLLKVNGWLTSDMRSYRFSSLAREALFAKEGQVPASSGLSIDGLPWNNATVAFDAIAAVPGTPGAKNVQVPTHEIVTTYVSATSAGPLVFTAGEVPISISKDLGTPRAMLIEDETDLGNDGRSLSFGRIHRTDHYLARAWYVYGQLNKYLNEYGVSLGDVVHQTIYLCDPTQYPDVERAATLFYGPTLPPTTLIPINDTSPFPDACLEIEVIAYHRDAAATAN